MIYTRRFISSKIPFNKITLLLTLSDMFTFGFYLILSSLIGVYLAKKFNQEIESVIGIGTFIYFLVRGLLQFPVGYLTDKLRGEKDEALILALGNSLMGSAFVLLPIITNIYQYYLLQILYGIGTSFNLVNWRKLFAKNLDKDKEGKEYAIYETAMSFTSAILSFLGGVIASINAAWFDLVIRTIGLIMISASIFPLLIFKIKKINQ